MGKKKKKTLRIANRYVFTNPDTNNHVSVNLQDEGEGVRFFVYIGDGSHHFTLTRKEAAQLARNVHLLLDDTAEPEDL